MPARSLVHVCNREVIATGQAGSQITVACLGLQNLIKTSSSAVADRPRDVPCH